MIRLALSIIFVLFAAAPVRAQAPLPPEQISTDISTHEVFIETDFDGIQAVIFGAVENGRQISGNQGLYDVVIALQGPPESIVVRRKDRVAGIWANMDGVTFTNVPGFYAMLSTRPLVQIAPPETLTANGLGFEALRLVPESKAAGMDEDESAAFRDALIDLKRKARLYFEDEKSVVFVGKSLFRGEVKLPSTVPVGNYKASVYLFRGGRLLSRADTGVVIEKAGIGAFITAGATEKPLLYGIAACIVAVMTGLAGWALFRSGP